MESTRWSRLAVLYACTIFLGAFLLFQLQPLISRFILPWFGGGPAVWTTCLLFFQTVLFAGYAYAHLSEHYLPPRVRTIVHLTLIVAAILTLPITPSDGWKPADSDQPTARILTLLAVCVGLPYFVLASTGPLVQAWFSRTIPGRSPYRLYSLSNVGSLVALLSYPFAVEPLLSGSGQSLWWTAGFVLFGLLCGIACWLTAKLCRAPVAAAGASVGANPELAAEANAEDPAASLPAPSWIRRLLWLLLPAFASMLLMATTNHVCQDMSPMPLLWVVPLSLYLLTFIIAFDHERWYRRLPYALAGLLVIYLVAGMSNPGQWATDWMGDTSEVMSIDSETPSEPSISYGLDLFCQFTGLFLLCMLCHGELVRLRPAPRYLTSFYLMIAAGGALGGLSVSIVAPQVFHSYAEWKIGLVGGFVLAATIAFLLSGPTGAEHGGWRRQWLSGLGALRVGGFLATLLALIEIIPLLRDDMFSHFAVLEQTRNFYGVLSVTDENAKYPSLHVRSLYNGGTMHGTQYTDDERKLAPTVYYSTGSGVGMTLDYYRSEAERSGAPLRVGAVGLGAGTLATYVKSPLQAMRFYEIDPGVARVAETYFTYLSDARQRGATVDVVLGDARLSLERELKQGQIFDVLVLDAFSSDSIPIHLLTQEAFELYFRCLAPEGALAVHISNRHLDLAPVVFGLAKQFGIDRARVYTVDLQHSGWPTRWIILSRNQGLLEMLRTAKGNLPLSEPASPLPVWTDQWHNLLEILQ